jgi:ABC-type glutathione transport system ATPase component
VSSFFECARCEKRSGRGAQRAASANVTTVLVAHKLQTVVDADLILGMSDGLLVEQGTHTSLLCQANSTYARMWAEQASGLRRRAQTAGSARMHTGLRTVFCLK